MASLKGSIVSEPASDDEKPQKENEQLSVCEEDNSAESNESSP